MESIIMKALPNNIHVGTIEMMELLNARSNHSKDQFVAENLQFIISEAKDRISSTNVDYDELISAIDEQGVLHPRVQNIINAEWEYYHNLHGFKYFGKPYKLRVILNSQVPTISVNAETKRIIVYEPGTKNVIADIPPK